MKQRNLNVTVTFDDEKLREIVDEIIIKAGLEQVVHCKDCKYYSDCYRVVEFNKDEDYLKGIDFCSYGERENDE